MSVADDGPLIMKRRDDDDDAGVLTLFVCPNAVAAPVADTAEGTNAVAAVAAVCLTASVLNKYRQALDGLIVPSLFPTSLL